jgi:choline dehydrogenase
MPLIHPNYLSTALDRQTIVAGIRMARRICRQAPVADLIVEEQAPGDRPSPMRISMGCLNWARDTATTIYHPTGTCRMGSGPDGGRR